MYWSLFLPAVDPDPPPTNIKNIIKSNAGMAIAPMSMVLNPAVRAVIL